MSREPIPQDVALREQLAMIAGCESPGSLLEIRYRQARGGMGQVFVPVRELDRAARAIRNRSQLTDVYVGAAPRVCESGSADAVERVWALWCDVDTPEALQDGAGFRPLPSIVIPSGSGGAHLWWPLREPLPPEWARRANRRLALALGGDPRATDAARIMRPAGTLNHKHDSPRPVTCTRLELDVFTLREVVGGLPDPPAPELLSRRATAMQGMGGIVGLVRVVVQAPEGNRNAALYWAACRLGDDCSELDAGREELREAALRRGLPEHETDATLASALDRRAVA